MNKRLKNDGVLSSTKPDTAAHAPITVNEPLVSWTESPTGQFNHRLTGTGFVCLIAPWLVVARRNIQFSIGEFLIFIIAWSASAGCMIGTMASRDTLLLILITQCTVLHSHCYTFVTSIYALSSNRRIIQELKSVRVPAIIALQVLPLLLWCTMSVMIRWVR